MTTLFATEEPLRFFWSYGPNAKRNSGRRRCQASRGRDSRIAASSRSLGLTKMRMATVNKSIKARGRSRASWSNVEVFAADLEPVCADPAADNDDAPYVAVRPGHVVRRVSIACCRSRSGASLAPASRRAKVWPRRSHSSRRPSPQLSDHPALPLSLKPCAHAPFALASLAF
jgi:hypothetical protein